MPDLPDYLSALNSAQRQAVLADNNAVIILAGPGSGKTRTLTSRVADLICRRSINPSAITVVTFTNKAANEMKNRLAVMLGPSINRRLTIGTFHAVCGKYLRAYGPKIGLASSFVILDRSDSESYVKRALTLPKIKKQIQETGDDRTPSPSFFLTFISKAKSRNSDPESESVLLKSQLKHSVPREDIRIAVYREYERLLRENQALDFDDLLIFGLKLLRARPKISLETQHVLVDEFQDTNTIQLEITKILCSVNRCLTIVGDPDQSIYTWRSADITNLEKIKTEFPDHQAVYLEENYRSTQHILTAAHEVISQDKSRVKKSLFTNNVGGHPITVHTGDTPENEASYIAKEIQRLVATTEGLIDYGDFSILVRAAYLTRAVEAAFVHRRIPHVLVGGIRFYERAEIKDILAYLRLLLNPNDLNSFERAIKVPSRKVGDVSISKITLAARVENTTPLEILRRLLRGQKVPNVRGIRRDGIDEFIYVLDKLAALLNEPETSVQKLMSRLVVLIRFKEYLQHVHKKDAETRWENVEELLNSATRFHAVPAAAELDLKPEFEDSSVKVEEGSTVGETRVKEGAVLIDFTDDESDTVLETASSEQADQPNLNVAEYVTPHEQLAQYILSVSLASDVAETIDEKDLNLKDNKATRTNVTISTMHASKGLEWPVVFVAGSDQVPHPRAASSSERDEERRLMYVAMTRAQRLLYITHCHSRVSYQGVTHCHKSPILDCLYKQDGTNPKLINNITTIHSKAPQSLDAPTLDFFTQYRLTRPSSVTREMAKEQLRKMAKEGSSSSPQSYPIQKMSGFASASSLMTMKHEQPEHHPNKRSKFHRPASSNFDRNGM